MRRPSIVMLCDARALWLAAAQVILSGSADSSVPFFGAAASATTAEEIAGTATEDAITVNVPVELNVPPFASVVVITY